MRIACLMMQKNENTLLRPWLRYHSDLFGAENLFVFDNGSTAEVTKSSLLEHEKRGGFVNYYHSTKRDFDNKGALLAEYIKALDKQGSYDFFLPLDCDEFFALETRKGEVTTARDEILEYLSTLFGSQAALTIKGSYFNVLGRSARFSFYKEDATFFAAHSIAHLDEGYHAGRTKSGQQQETNIVHLHYAFRPYPFMKAAAEEKLRSRVKNFERETLKAFTGGGSHLVKYLLMTEEEYNAQFGTTGSIWLPAWEKRLSSLGCRLPYG